MSRCEGRGVLWLGSRSSSLSKPGNARQIHKYTNTNANAKICKYTNAKIVVGRLGHAHPLFAKPCNTEQSLLTLQDKASCNSYNGKMRAAGRVKKSASSCNRPILLLSHADHHHHHHGHCHHHHRLHGHRQQHQHQRRHYQC